MAILALGVLVFNLISSHCIERTLHIEGFRFSWFFTFFELFFPALLVTLESVLKKGNFASTRAVISGPFF